MKTIKNNKLEAHINLDGAYVEDLSYGEKSVFFPKSRLKMADSYKIRGGMHVCAPNFSDDNLLKELKSHGFGRDLTWKSLEEAEDHLLLGLDGIGSYEKVSFKISYKLVDNKLEVKLIVENKDDKKVPLAPAFHPYFKTSYEDLDISGVSINKEDLPDSIFLDKKDLSFKTKDFAIDIIGKENVSVYTIWSDFLGEYICLEPTYNGKSFMDLDKKVYYLNPNETFTQSFDILVKEN